ncbi:MAG: oligosaccharide flippase family protein, partial [Anaerolineales bacterium]|nr:oligosaccharide flippase family protein [Anaerolineales bacterium]
SNPFETHPLPKPLRTIRQFAHSRSLRQGMVLILGTTLAYGLDYLFNLVAGRILAPPQFGTLVALAGAGQVLVVASRVIQTVITRYVTEFQSGPDGATRTAAFFRRIFPAAWAWGGGVTVLLLLLSVPFARFLRTDDVPAVMALVIAAVLMAVRPVVGGVLQGTQRFAALGSVQIVQAGLRLVAGVLLMLAGWGAFGAMAALPVASGAALLFGLWLLGKDVWRPTPGARHQVAFADLLRYGSYAGAGLIGYALLANMDAILARRFFTPEMAGNYGAAVTLGKVVQFFPLAIVMILFPKAAQRRAEKRDPAGILLPAMLIVGLLCGGVALVYFLFPDAIVRLTLGSEYQVSGLLLGLLGVAMTLLSLANVWLNYFLSLNLTGYVYLVWVAIVLQAVLMALFHGALWHLPAIATGTGLWLTLAGGVMFWRARRRGLAGMGD